jgi:protein TonB
MGSAFEYEEEDQRAERMRKLAAAGAGAGIVLALGFGVWQLMKDAGGPRRRQVQQISVVQPRELPKPPPEPEKPKEEVKEQIKVPQPKPQDDAPPPEQSLGLDAKGAAGGDQFGLAGRPGGRDITTIGNTGGNGTGRGFGFYTSQLQSQLQEELNRKDKLRGSQYSATVSVWIAADGRVERVEITGSTGDPQTDSLLKSAVAGTQRLKAPPQDMPQPVRLRVSARGTG